MKRHAIGLALSGLMAILPAQAQKKPALSQVIVKAQFVMVMAQREMDFSQRPTSDDMCAVARVEEALLKWDRYKLVSRKEDADLVIAVRREGPTMGCIAGGVGGSGRPPLGVDVSSSGGDYMAVHMARPNISPASLWRRTQKDGLAMPKLPLFKAFHDEVEEAALKTP